MLKKTLSVAVLGLSALATMPAAQAANIGFEDIAPSLFTGGESFTESGYTMTVLDSMSNVGSGGLSAASIIGADPFTCSIIACPRGNAGSYFAGLNDGGINFARMDNTGFRVQSLDFAFVAPVDGLIDFSVGRLVLSGKGMNDVVMQTSVEFAPQVNGQFNFANFVTNNAFSHTTFKELSISACLYNGNGACVNPAMNQAQFALDNVNIAAVPEPSTYMMMGLGLAGLAALTRRRRKAA